MSKIFTRTFRVRWGELNPGGAVGVRIDKLPVDQEFIAREIWEREKNK
ncbi:MAG: hypothetical protein MHPDNHAH_00826 [Anaerolineales bacterium]|nr:hypothetical protein [Anaerolineales bacterium]WKZ46221.1 MAG: hypothetical protein QY306_10415 [Anaerolineales bacterium]